MTIKRIFGGCLVLLLSMGVFSAVTSTLNEIESLLKNKKYSIALEKSLNLLNTSGAGLSQREAGALHYFIGLAYEKSGNLEMAVTYLKKIEIEFPTSNYLKQSYVELADIYKGDFFQWEAYLEKIFEQFPKSDEAVRAGIELVKGNLKLQNFKKTVPIVGTLVNLWNAAEDNPELYMLAALSYSGVNDYIEAIDYLRTAEKTIRKTIDNNPLYVFEAGKICYNNQNFRKAIEYLNRLFNVYPNYKHIAEATILMAQSYERENNLFMSAVYLIKAIEKNPAIPRRKYSLMLNLGRVLSMLEDEELERIKRFYPLYSNPQKLLNIVKANSPVFEQKREAAILLSGEFKKAKNFEKVVDNYYRFLRDKRDPLVEKYFRENLNLYIDDLKRSGGYDRIFKFWVVIKDRKSYLSDQNLLKLGEILLEMKLYENAEEVFQHMNKYTIYEKEWPAARRNLARIYFAVGRYNDYLDIFKKIEVTEEPEKSEFAYYTLRVYKELKMGEEFNAYFDGTGITSKTIENPFRYRVLELKGEQLEGIGENTLALNIYNDMILYPQITSPQRFRLILKIADVYYKNENWDSSLEYYERAEKYKAAINETGEKDIQLAPEPETTEWILFRKIFIYKNTQREELAAETLEQLREVNPDSFWIRQVEKNVG
jgi:tetratricopeptide (TPR) repeat protein